MEEQNESVGKSEPEVEMMHAGSGGEPIRPNQTPSSENNALPTIINSIIAENPNPYAVITPHKVDRGQGWVLWLIVPILLLGAFFRFSGINWDQFTHLHPDERFLTIVASKLQTVSNPIDYLRTSESTLNPYNAGEGFYVYGNFPMTVTRYVAEYATAFCELLTDGCQLFDRQLIFTAYDGVHIIGRALSAILDLISIFFIFLIGRRLYGWKTGLLAALLLSMSVMAIQQSHFFTADNWGTALTTVTIYFAVRASERFQKRWYILFGIFLGLTVASRINVAPLAGVIGIAAIVWLSHKVGEWNNLWTPHGMDLLLKAALGVMLAAVISLMTFRVAMPYAFADREIAREIVRTSLQESLCDPENSESVNTCRDVVLDEISPNSLGVIARSIFAFNPQWWDNMEEIQNQQKPDFVFPPALQWTNRTDIVFPLTNMVFYGMGITAGIAAIIGLFWAVLRIFKARPEWQAHMIPVIWAIVYFVFTGTRWVKSVRYFLPIYPVLLLLAGWVLMELWNRSANSRRNRVFAGFAMAIVVVPTFLWANAFLNVYTNDMTRIAASRWMYDNVKSAATIIYEVDGVSKELQLPLKDHLFQVDGPPSYVSFDMEEDGVLTAFRFNYLTDEQTSSDPIRLEFALTQNEGLPLDGAAPFQVGINVPEPRSEVLIPLSNVSVSAETRVTIQTQMVSGGILLADTTNILNEHWDDALPARLDGKDGYFQYFVGIQDPVMGVDGNIPITATDDENKREGFYRWLDSADMIVLSSQRAIWSTPRLAMSYPLTMQYYESLFNEELGFDLVQEFHADLSIGPLHISDTGGTIGWGEQPKIGWPPPSDITAAEEAFSVYDHPPVWIFAKSADYDPQLVRNALSSVDLTNVVGLNPGQATAAPTGLMMAEQTFAQQQAGGTFSEIFNPDSILNQNPVLAAVVWWLAVVILGWLAVPLTYKVLPGLPTRGYALARILSILIVSYFGWITASVGILNNTRTTYWLGVILVALISLAIVLREGDAIIEFLKRHSRYILTVELLAVGLYILSILIRLGNPDVWDVIWGGEKPMDLTYFTAVLKSTSFPPYDPWFAGGTLNYYYYGFVYVGVLTKLLGIVPATAYNLIIPMLYSFTGVAAFALAYNLFSWRSTQIDADKLPSTETSELNRKATLAGFSAMALTIILGNLGQLGVIFEAWRLAGDPTLSESIPFVGGLLQSADGAIKLIGEARAPIYPGNWFWNASRAISVPEGEIAPITEFPFFTFLYGDLHAHMIALPLTLLALGWIVSFALRDISVRRPSVATWLIGGLTIGVLFPTNSWDWGTYLVLGMLGIVLYNLRVHRTVSLGLFGDTIMHMMMLGMMSFMLFMPFTQNFGAGFTEISRWDGATTGLGSYLTIYGLFLLLILTHLLREVRAWARSLSVSTLEKTEPFALPIGLSILILLGVLVLAWVRGLSIVPLAGFIVIVAGLLAFNSGFPANRRILLALISSAFFLTIFVDVFVIEGTVGRMNTVFKFYMQVWVILSVVGGVALAMAWPATKQWGSLRRTAWRTALGTLVFIAFLYPPLATNAKWEIRMSDEAPNTLDGMAFMETTTYEDSGRVISLAVDYAALQWMQRNIEGSPVVAEAYSNNYYRSIGNRVAMYTGLPSIVGWRGHQEQQRNVLPNPRVGDRVFDVEKLYNSTDPAEAMQVINRYDVSYIYVGALEETYYAPEGLAKFREMAAIGMLESVYDEQGVVIYRVMDSATAANY